jgi:endonuclease/exonuclease/phosphatase family metal-dependent hydrolase
VSTVTDLIVRKALDVVCLQELAPLSVTPPRASVHRALARATGWDSAFAVHPRLYPGWLEAVGILTRLPIARGRRIRLGPGRGHVQAVVRSAVLGEVCIGCIHLSSPARRRRELRRAVSEAPRRRSILAGDFNLRPDDPILTSELPGLASDDLPGVDHVYVSPDLRIVRSEIEPTAASDHDAVVVSIEPQPVGSRQGA